MDDMFSLKKFGDELTRSNIDHGTKIIIHISNPYCKHLTSHYCFNGFVNSHFSNRIKLLRLCSWCWKKAVKWLVQHGFCEDKVKIATSENSPA